MTTKQDVAEALRASVQRAEKIAAGISDADATRVVLPGWTVKDVYAHLASLGASPSFFIAMAQRAASGSGGGGGMGGGFDINAFNAQQVEMRKGKSLEELLAEFRQGHEQGIALMESTPDEVLTKEMPDPFRGGMATALAMIQGSCAEHEAGHLDDVVAALRG
jgi:uncharacterized protein (TIGR03083 family)